MDFPTTIMFYDGGCPLCRREVAHYRRLDRAGRLEWVDISRESGLLQAFGVSFQTGMERLHVLYRDGRLLTGAYAFAAVWSELPYYRWLARLAWLPGVLPCLDRLYGRFARWRFRRRCAEGVCALPPGGEQFDPGAGRCPEKNTL
jgi:predicted DCC family thiol-disulfide oxidoreductase YuxK